MRHSGMHRMLTLAALLLLPLALPACHHVIIESGQNPGNQVHLEEWNLAFAAAIYPAQIDAAGYCGGGEFSRVETRQSFLNLVVAAVTSGIITPMESKVVCARGGMRDGDGAEGGSP